MTKITKIKKMTKITKIKIPGLLFDSDFACLQTRFSTVRPPCMLGQVAILVGSRD